MTTHQLATLLEHLQLGLGDGLKNTAGTSFAEAAGEFRALPDQSLKELFKSLRKASTPQPGSGPTGNSPAAGTAGVIDRIRAVRGGTAPAESVELNELTKDHLKEILRVFQQPVGGNKDALVQRVRQLCVRVEPTSAPPHPANGVTPEPPLSAEFDIAVEEGVRIFTRLKDDRKLTISDVRAGFEPLRGYPKPVVEEISRRLKYTPDGSRAEILDRLLSNLEGIKMSQYRMDQILTGT